MKEADPASETRFKKKQAMNNVQNINERNCFTPPLEAL
jgi:hypothetical protein